MKIEIKSAMPGFVAGPGTPRLGKSSRSWLRETGRFLAAVLATIACALALALLAGCGVWP